MLVTSMLVIIIQTKCISMANFPEYFDHAATQPGSGPNHKTMREFPLPALTPWVTLFPTPTLTPKTNATTERTRTTLGLVTNFFYVGKDNFSNVFTSSTKSTILPPYLTGFMTTPPHKVTFPPFVIMTTLTRPSTDIIIPTILAGKFATGKLTRPTPYLTSKKPHTYIDIARPNKLPPTVPPTALPTLPPPKTLPTTSTKKVYITKAMKPEILRNSSTVPTGTNKTLTRNATNKTNTTKPSVKVSTTVKLQANTTTSPKNKGLTTIKTKSKNPKRDLNKLTTIKPTTTPGLNKTNHKAKANLTSKNVPDVPTVSKSATTGQISSTSTTSAIVERTPNKEVPTTTALYEDVIEYEELTTEPFSKFLERLLFLLAKMEKLYATKFIRSFEKIVKMRLNKGAFHNFGPITVRYMGDMIPGLETSTDTLQRMFALGYSSLKSRRKSLAFDTNELLDYMDMMFTVPEEKLMKEILDQIAGYPNTSKPAADITADVVNGVLIMPSKRLSGTKKGNLLFKSLDTIIVSRHPNYDHHRKNLENKGKAIAAITNQVGKSNRGNFDSFHYSNSRRLRALNHVSESNRRYNGSIKNAKGKKNKAMHYLNKGNIRKWIHVNEGDEKKYDRINNGLRRKIEPTNHGTESNRRNDGSIHNDKSREVEINHVNGDKRKYDSINYSKGGKSKAKSNFNKATRKNNSSINIAKNKGSKAINDLNKSNRKKYKMARKKHHDRRFGKENLRRSYNIFSGRFQTAGWISDARESDNNKYYGETDNAFATFSDSDEFVQSESNDENDEIEMGRQRKANIVYDRIQKLKYKSVIEPVMKTKTVRRQGRKKIKWGLPSWNPNEYEFAVLRQGHYSSQRRTDPKNTLLNNRGLLLKKSFPNNKNKFEIFRQRRPSSELPFQKVFIKNKNNNNILGIGPQYDNVNFSPPIKTQFQNNILPVKKSFVSRQLKTLQINKRFHNYKPKMEEIGEPSPWPLMDKAIINRTSSTFSPERYTDTRRTPYTYFSRSPLATLNNKSNNQRQSYNYNEMNKNIGRLIPSNARPNQVMSVNYDNSPSIIDFSMKVKLKKPQDARDGELVFVNDHYVNKVNMRGNEAQVTEETRTWDPYQMDKYFGKTKVTRRAIKKREYVKKPVSETSDNSESDMTHSEQDVDDEESEQDESDRYTFKGVNRKNTHSKHRHKYREKHHKRKKHDKHKRKKQRRNERQRHGTHKKNRKKHGFRPNTKKRKHGRNKHSHHKNHRYHKNKRGKKPHSKKYAMAIDPIRNRASETRPIPVGNLYKYEKQESSSSEEESSNSTAEDGIPAPENKKYKPIGKLMELDKASTLKSNNEVETFKIPGKLNSPERGGSEAQPNLVNKPKEDKNNVIKARRNPKRRGAFVTIGLLMDDMIYRFRENELKRNVYDAFRQSYRRNYRRTMGKEFHPPVLPPIVIREDSVYTDDEAVLKRNIYKAIKRQNANPDMLDQNKPNVLKRKF